MSAPEMGAVGVCRHCRQPVVEVGRSHQHLFSGLYTCGVSTSEDTDRRAPRGLPFTADPMDEVYGEAALEEAYDTGMAAGEEQGLREGLRTAQRIILDELTDARHNVETAIDRAGAL